MLRFSVHIFACALFRFHVEHNIMQKLKISQANEINEIEVNKTLFHSSSSPEILARYENDFDTFMEVNGGAWPSSLLCLRWQKCVIIIHVHEAEHSGMESTRRVVISASLLGNELIFSASFILLFSARRTTTTMTVLKRIFMRLLLTSHSFRRRFNFQVLLDLSSVLRRMSR